MSEFLLRDPQPLADPDGITDPVCLTLPTWRSQLRRCTGQAGEAIAVIGSIMAVGLMYAAF